MANAKGVPRFNHHKTYHVPKKTCTGTCARCGNDFTYEMTRKRHTLCVPCKPIAEKEQRKIAEKNRRDRIKQNGPPEPKKKLIPYAGYSGRSDW